MVGQVHQGYLAANGPFDFRPFHATIISSLKRSPLPCLTIRRTSDFEHVAIVRFLAFHPDIPASFLLLEGSVFSKSKNLKTLRLICITAP